MGGITDMTVTIRQVCLVLFILLASIPVFAAAPSSLPKNGGVICIAPFHVKEPNLDPIMSTTPAATSETVFTFIVDKRLKATVKMDEMGMITGVPTDRKVKVEVRTAEAGFETFWLHLGKEPEHRSCLWLYPDYWHWIDNGWDPKLGCKCKPGNPAPQ
jgi:hypothetical protein